MRDLLIIILIALLTNLIFLSIGYSQNNVNIEAVVPATEFNRQVPRNLKINKPSFKENKYLYFFQKSVELQGDALADKQTWHDKVSSYIFLIAVLTFFAVLFSVSIRLIDKYLFRNKSNDT